VQFVVQTLQSLTPAPARAGFLCLGGSFNPIHLGHLICSRAVAERCGYAGVRLIPAATNPHKAATDLAETRHRLAMCQAAVAGDPFFLVDPIELNREGPSYTFDTVTQLLASGAEPGPKVAWLVGADHLGRLHAWHRFAELIERVDFVVMQRAGEPIDLEGMDGRVKTLALQMVRAPQIEISSTALRHRVRAGMPIRNLVPPEVARYIADHRLYVANQ
jgi:nicotinate-nucleotide adenylyltransferase